jgi:hypothetical protein
MHKYEVVEIFFKPQNAASAETWAPPDWGEPQRQLAYRAGWYGRTYWGRTGSSPRGRPVTHVASRWTPYL